MSAEPPTLAYLRALRQAQITGRREGLEEARRAAHEANRPGTMAPESDRLRFTKHARYRMNERGLRARDVYKIWRSGDRRPHRSAPCRWYASTPNSPYTLVVAGPDDQHDEWRLITVLG